VRRHAKASSAGSTTRQASGLGRIFRGVFATRGSSSDAKGSGASSAGRKAFAATAFAALLALLALAIPASAADPVVVTSPVSNNTGVHATLNGTVNPEGEELSECFFEWTQSAANLGGFEYDQVVPCAESPATIGAGTSAVAVHADLSGLAPQNTRYHYRLVAKNPTSAAVNGSDEAFETPTTVITEAASGIADTEATLNGTVNPDTATISACVFEWGPLQGVHDNVQEYPESASCVPGPGGITGTSPVAVQADLSGLHPGTTYAYRLRATYPTGPATGSTLTVQTAGPVITDSWSEDVLYTEATLKAEINPEAAPTTYHFEYGTTTAYGTETAEAAVGSDSSSHKLEAFLEELEPGTTYHWRVVATSAAGENDGPDHEIRTFRRFVAETECPNQTNRYGAGADLPDCRAYEMVSPVNKDNGDIESPEDADAVAGVALSSRTQSTPSGDKVAYSSYRAFADAGSVPWVSEYMAQRTGEGWQTHSLNPPGGKPLLSAAGAIRAEYEVFSEDLCHGWMRDFFDSPSLGGEPGSINLYRRDDRSCGSEAFQPLESEGAYVQAVSADGSHALFTVSKKLYESVEPGATRRYVCILPNGEPWPGICTAGGGEDATFESSTKGAISEDGERIFWTDTVGRLNGKIYVRIGGTETVAVSGPAEEEVGGTEDGSFFWGAAADGSRAIFTTSVTQGHRGVGENLYAFDVDSETTHLIAGSPDGSGQVDGVAGISKDARRVYFVAHEALPGSGQNDEGEEAIPGQPNLYLYDADTETSTFIATLSNEDAGTGFGGGLSLLWKGAPGHTAHVTPDGLHLAFASSASLTGYDNVNPTAGVEGNALNRLAYVYDAESNELFCVSCNPSGARGQFEVAHDGKVVYETFGVPLPGFEFGSQPSRLLSDDGSRLFFESANALDPRDSNGKVDVYEWERLGHGGCDASDSRFAPSAGGCIYLISSGTNAHDSLVAEASVTGDDVFFYTGANLVPQDFALRDIYDARVGGGFPLPTKVAACEGEACQNAPEAPTDPTPGSSSYNGPGNVTEQPAASKKHKKKHHKRRHAHKRHRANNNRRASR
jgi:hypothetical protein